MNRYFFTLIVLLLLSPARSASQAQEKIRIIHGPYLQAVAEDKATVVWVTDREAVSWVEIAPDDGSHFYATTRPKYYDHVFGQKKIGTLHAVKLSGLDPGTTYRYRIYSEEVVVKQHNHIGYGPIAASAIFRGRPYSFTTLDPAKHEAWFAVVNDIHGKNQLLGSLMSQVDFGELDMVFFNGDMVSAMQTREQTFRGFVDTAAVTFGAEVPFFYARGNHETRGLFAPEFIDYFPTITGTPYYAFRHGPVFFLVLDCAEDKPDTDIEYHGLGNFDPYREEQARWLQEVVASEEFRSSPVKIAVLHIALGADGWHGQREMNRLFLPLLNGQGIDLMLSGHQHRYIWMPVGERNCDFPILVNCFEHISVVKATQNSLSVTIKDAEGKVFKEIGIK